MEDKAIKEQPAAGQQISRKWTFGWAVMTIGAYLLCLRPPSKRKRRRRQFFWH